MCSFAAEYTVNGRPFGVSCPVLCQVKVHSALLKLFNPDRRRFEFGGSGLGIDGVNRKIVGRHLIVKMQRKKGKSRAQTCIEVDRSDNGAASRTDADFFPFAHIVAGTVFGGEIESLPAAQRGGIPAALYTGVVRIEATAGRQANWEFRVKLIHGRFKFNGIEGRARADQRFLPEPAVKVHFPRVRLIVAGPLNAAELFEARVAHAGVHGTEPAKLVPDAFCVGLAPVVTEAAGKLEENFRIIANAFGKRQSTADALHAAFAARDRAFAFAPSRRSGKNDVG